MCCAVLCPSGPGHARDGPEPCPALPTLEAPSERCSVVHLLQEPLARSQRPGPGVQRDHTTPGGCTSVPLSAQHYCDLPTNPPQAKTPLPIRRQRAAKNPAPRPAKTDCARVRRLSLPASLQAGAQDTLDPCAQSDGRCRLTSTLPRPFSHQRFT